MATDNNKDFTLSLAEAQHLTQENTSAMNVYQTFKDFSLVSNFSQDRQAISARWLLYLCFC